MINVNRALQRQRGSIYVEYLFATLVLMVTLFAPIPGAGVSVVQLVVWSIDGFYQHSAYLLSLP